MVIRVSKSGMIGESRPCYHCLHMLEKSNINIKHIYYTTSDNNIMCEQFHYMKTNELTYIPKSMKKNY